VVAAPEAGVLVDRRDARGLADGITALLAAMPERDRVRRYAEGFSWEETSQAQVTLFNRMRADAVSGRVAEPSSR